MQLPYHDVTLEASWPQLFVDHKGQYWEVPESISLDLLSLVSDSGLRYRFGIHKNAGHPQAINSTNADAPSALMPGLCAKAAFSYEKSRDFWRRKERREDIIDKTEKGSFWRPSYDLCLREPHAAISGIFGKANALKNVLFAVFSPLSKLGCYILSVKSRNLKFPYSTYGIQSLIVYLSSDKKLTTAEDAFL